MLKEDIEIKKSMDEMINMDIGEVFRYDKNGVKPTPEALGLAMIKARIFGVDDAGHIWRYRKRVGRRTGVKYIKLDPPERAEHYSNKRPVLVVYDPINRKRTCITISRLLWAYYNNRLPKESDIVVHVDGDMYNNRKENLLTKNEIKQRDFNSRRNKIVAGGRTVISKNIFNEIYMVAKDAPIDDQPKFRKMVEPLASKYGLDWIDFGMIAISGWERSKSDVKFIVIPDEEYERIK